MMNWKQYKKWAILCLVVILAVPAMGLSAFAAESTLTLPHLDLPTGAEITMKNSSSNFDISVDWDAETPKHDPGNPGIYYFSGSLIMATTVFGGPTNFRAKLVVEVDANSMTDMNNEAPDSESSLPLVDEFTLRGDTNMQVVSMEWGVGPKLTEDRKYLFSGDLVLAIGADNPQKYKANFSILVDPRPFRNVTGIHAIADKTVALGTPQSQLDLPQELSITLDYKKAMNAAVTWDEGTPAYNANQAGTYTFKGTLALPPGVENPKNLEPSLNVVVEDQVLYFIEVEKLSNKTVPYGTKASELELPQGVEVTLSDNTKIQVYVDWDKASPEYNANQPGTYTFSGTLAEAKGFENPDNLKASLDVVVEEKSVVSDVEKLNDKAVTYGTLQSQLNLPSEIEVTLDNSKKQKLAVTWDMGTPAYNGNQAGTYSFKGSLTLPEGIANPENIMASLNVKVSPRVIPPTFPPFIPSEPSLNCGAAGCNIGTQYGLIIKVPANLHAQDFSITIQNRNLNEQQQSKLPQYQQILAEALELGKTFEGLLPHAVTLNFKLDGDKLTKGHVPSLYQYDETEGIWIEVPSNVEDGVLAAEVKQLGVFVLLAVEGTSVNEETESEGNDLILEDIKGHWAQEQIEKAIQLQIVKGYEDGSFRPNELISREAFVTMLARAFQWSTSGQQAAFNDANRISSWAKDAVAAAIEKRLIGGYEDGSFRPNEAMTRAQIAVIAAGMLPSASHSENNMLNEFNDKQDIPNWAESAFQAAVKEEILVGTDESQLQPNRNVTRAEAIAIILRLLGKLEEEVQ